MSKEKLSKYIRAVLTVILLVVAGVCLYQFGSHYINKHNEEKKQQAIRQVIDDNALTDAGFSFSHGAWDALYGMNDDFVGYLAFPDEYVSEAVYHAPEESYYLYLSGDKTWSEFGSIYLDPDEQLTDTNITLFGHHIVGIGFENMKFSPIAALVEQSVYDEHHEFSVWWENRRADYIITDIFYYNADEEYRFDFKQQNFDNEDDFNKYYDHVHSNNIISSPETLAYGDRFLTLQTCRDLWSSVRIIAVCKQINEQEYK